MEKKRSVLTPVILALCLGAVLLRIVFLPYQIPMDAMSPALRMGDRVFVNTWAYKFQQPQRGDVILFPCPLDLSKEFMARIVGLPNEQIEIANGKVFINGDLLLSPHKYFNVEDWEFGQTEQLIKIPADSYFVMGDNPEDPPFADSRKWGFVKQEGIRGKVCWIFSPFKRFGKVS